MTQGYRREAMGRMRRMQERVAARGDGDRWAVDMRGEEKAEYGRAMRRMRAARGLTDGLKCEPKEFHDYLARRRAEDAKRRGW